ncbi:MAG TPA: ethanolamine ammonia-lyase subunit EutC [Stellaceae bacterium]|nr:ethanolamine ammonia-lyase subunit EutC [Stellaceae bacterium]
MTWSVERTDPWFRLRRHTPARIGLARTGASLATAEHLAFQLAHARARDAVHVPLQPAPLLSGLTERGLEAISLRSAAATRQIYLLRPDLGRRLDDASRDHVGSCARDHDLALVVADGLSPGAVQRHALPLIDALLPELKRHSLRIGPVAVVEQGRVAVGDEIGAALGAASVLVLIGERPGLSAPESLGVYLTWAPQVGRVDAERNCLSNIRPEGLSYSEAAAALFYLLSEARRRRLTGVTLKADAHSSSASRLATTGRIDDLR